MFQKHLDFYCSCNFFIIQFIKLNNRQSTFIYIITNYSLGSKL